MMVDLRVDEEEMLVEFVPQRMFASGQITDSTPMLYVYVLMN